jgi:hypothetical protein
MSNLAIYNENSQSLGTVAFIKNTSSQTLIRNITDSYEITKNISMFITVTTNRLGIKEALHNLDKADITEMLLTKYKSISFDEIYYAFKMERYGDLGDRIHHFQLFNTEYISQVLDKYIVWKRKMKIEHNISEQKKEVVVSEEEKQYWINKGVTECLEYFEENSSVMDGKLYVYDIFYDMGYLPTDLAYKNKIKKDAIDVIEFEQKSKRPSSVDEKKEIAFILADILKPKSGILIGKCKELVLLEFLRKLYWDSEKVMELKEKFEIRQAK